MAELSNMSKLLWRVTDRKVIHHYDNLQCIGNFCSWPGRFLWGLQLSKTTAHEHKSQFELVLLLKKYKAFRIMGWWAWQLYISVAIFQNVFKSVTAAKQAKLTLFERMSHVINSKLFLKEIKRDAQWLTVATLPHNIRYIQQVTMSWLVTGQRFSFPMPIFFRGTGLIQRVNSI